MILFFGWKVRFATVSEGQFHCPYCRADRPYERQLARRWFTLFFLPILPLKVLGEVVKCGYCHNHFDLECARHPDVGCHHRAVTRRAEGGHNASAAHRRQPGGTVTSGRGDLGRLPIALD